MSRLTPAVLAIALLGCNDAPTPLTVHLGPVGADTQDDLEVTLVSPSRDADGDPVEHLYTWSVDGTVRDDLTGPVVPAAETARGQVWTVSVVGDDGKDQGEAATAEITISNAVPVAEASIGVTEVRSTEAFEMTGSGTDPDGDDIEMQWYWTRDGEGTPVDGPRVSAGFTTPGEVWVGHAVAFDGEARSEPATVQVTILNGRPAIDSLVLEPAPDEAFTDTSLTAVVAASDPDGEPVTLTYTWTVDGTQVLSGVDFTTLDSRFFAKHQTVAVTVVPEDQVEAGDPATLEVTINNALATAPGIAITPEEPLPGLDDMRCVITEPSTDIDGDPITYRVAWTVDGEPFTGAVDGDLPGDTVPAEAIADESDWTCRVVPMDDDGDGIAAERTLTAVLWSGPRVFTPCGARGATGPDPEDCAGTRDGYAGTSLEGEVTLRDGIQSWTVPVSGTYRIEAFGAQGSSASRSGGTGAILRGDFELERGQELLILVGQEGQSDGRSAGGGGASWVMLPDDTPLLVAAGGGGAGTYASFDGCGGLTGGYAGQGGGTATYGSARCRGAKSDGLGQGGLFIGDRNGNGGGGYETDGGSDTRSGGTGGRSWFNGATGGTGGANGGFGGGGSGTGSWASGGGGGYSGGDAGRALAGGGGSFNDGADPRNRTGHTGDGEVEIDFLGE